ncbi:MAG: alpha/beta fold hydrolase [Actinomycetota bacterium]|nr:alpha/beta fold hydrolase [Actinomycetota bacterium]
MLKALVILALVLLALLALLWGFQRRLIYLPSPAAVPRAAEVLPRAREVILHTSDRLELGAWFVPPTRRDRAMGVLVTNGNAGNRSLRAPLARSLADRGFAVLLFDYRGYGGNPGKPTEQGLARDARAARRYFVEEAGVRPDRLLYFGESLGAAVATELATEHPPAGLLLRSPFTDLASAGQVHYPFLPVRTLLRDRFPLAEQLARVSVPTTVVYGSRDSVVPADQSRAVAEAAGGPTRVIELAGADHNHPALLDGEEVIAAVVELAERADARE